MSENTVGFKRVYDWFHSKICLYTLILKWKNKQKVLKRLNSKSNEASETQNKITRLVYFHLWSGYLSMFATKQAFWRPNFSYLQLICVCTVTNPMCRISSNQTHFLFLFDRFFSYFIFAPFGVYLTSYLVIRIKFRFILFFAAFGALFYLLTPL